MQVFAVISKLIDYPDSELIENLDSVIEYIKDSSEIATDEKEILMEFVSWMRSHTSIKLQETYVETFDMVPEHDLHLTHHIFGDDRGRGPALIDLSEHLKNEGLEVKEGEIPDFLPLLLEYASTLDDIKSRAFLGDAKKIIKIIADNLDKAKSPYSKLIRIVEKHSCLTIAA
ncbi:MAG: nitrate reductase molybdenum cofactor assembly chaperone [Candidatus Thioglobus sp.]|jgi:nitrate reductase delta subunit|nr:nitrate reductase molybdenum cofactor assembly chaperone [Candidatus Neomarinimicrobiota bacterium]MDP7553910.1 nitrate reductase molybdenum cofactor assembly chaperone [Candidatus Thioglobus sp.]|tara:strand:- start:656 stop:1171 length:516 start_codon:yes stop_codon:yes gene_type:complete